MNRNIQNIVQIIARICVLCCLLFILTVQVYAADVDSKGAWVLTDIMEFNTKDELDAYNNDPNNAYDHEMSGSNGSFTLKTVYTGKDDRYYDPPKLYGESVTVKAVFSVPPSVIYPGEPFSITLDFNILEDNSSFYNFGGNAYAFYGTPPTDFDSWHKKGRIINADGAYSFKIEPNHNPGPIHETLSTQFSTGNEDGARIAIKVGITGGNSYCTYETYYIYEWQSSAEMIAPASSATSSDTSTSSATSHITSQVTPSEHWVDRLMPDLEEEEEPYPYNYSPKDENGDYIDSGFRVNDVGGEVLIRHGDDRLGWEFLEPGMIIHEGDHIQTRKDAYVSLSLPDMTIFVMKPESELIIDYDSTKKESKWAILNGKVYANVKHALKYGTMNVEMAQAVAGIKGTIFVCEEIDGVSTLKVIEGKVTFTDKAGEVVTVKTGQMVSADENGLTAVTAFDVDEEYASWDGFLTEEAAESHQNNTLMIILILAAVLILGGVTAFFVTKKRHPTIAGGTVPLVQPAPAKFCGNCGKPVRPGGTFCSNCGQNIK